VSYSAVHVRSGKRKATVIRPSIHPSVCLSCLLMFMRLQLANSVPTQPAYILFLLSQADVVVSRCVLAIKHGIV